MKISQISDSPYINYDSVQFPEKWPRFQDFLVSHMQELTCGDYGELLMLWFDQCVPSQEYAAPVPWDKMATVARANQPGIMIVARWEGNIYENYKTPEQNIPDEVLDYPWKSCITMSNSWSWRPNAAYNSTRSRLLGAERTKLKCIPSENGVKVLIPEKLRHVLPCQHIWCLRLKYTVYRQSGEA